MKEKDKKISVVKNNLYFLGLLWKVSPMGVVLCFLENFIQYAFWVFYSVFFMQYLFGTKEGLRSFPEIAIFIVVSLLINIIFRAFSMWFWNVYTPKFDIRVHYGLNMKLFSKVQSVDVSCFETPEFYNTYTKAATEASDRAQSDLNNISSAIGSFFSSVYVIVTMATITPWSLVFITLPLFANLYLGKRIANLEFKENEETIGDWRRIDYGDRIIYFRKYAGELRLTNIYNVLEKMFKKSADNITDIKMKYAARYAFVHGIKNVMMFL